MKITNATHCMTIWIDASVWKKRKNIFAQNQSKIILLWEEKTFNEPISCCSVGASFIKNTAV